MGKPQVSFSKRQREQAKRERQKMKVEKRDQRASEPKKNPADDEFQLLTGNEPREDFDIDKSQGT